MAAFKINRVKGENMSRGLSALIVLISAVVVLAACSSDDGVVPPVPDAAPSEAGSERFVEIANFTLPDIVVSTGTIVTWSNEDSAPHTTTSGENGVFDGDGWNSPTLSQYSTFSFTFNDAGVFKYTCRIHSNMSGSVTVQ